jgi:hypothetical protein
MKYECLPFRNMGDLEDSYTAFSAAVIQFALFFESMLHKPSAFFLHQSQSPHQNYRPCGSGVGFGMGKGEDGSERVVDGLVIRIL